jgi:hypothetical protein
MGRPRLKIKNTLNYRPGGTAHHCSDCNYFGKLLIFHKGELEPRCKKIGENQGIEYRINPKYICDQYDNSEVLKRLREF